MRAEHTERIPAKFAERFEKYVAIFIGAVDNRYGFFIFYDAVCKRQVWNIFLGRVNKTLPRLDDPSELSRQHKRTAHGAQRVSRDSLRTLFISCLVASYFCLQAFNVQVDLQRVAAIHRVKIVGVDKPPRNADSKKQLRNCIFSH